MTDIDRQLAALERELAALRATFPPDTDFRVPAPKPRRGRPGRPPQARATGPTPPPPQAGLAAAKPSPPPPPPRPTGTDLHGDPKNYGVLPDQTRLEPGSLSPEAFKARLSGDLKCAEEILHTSGVPALTWREWRQFQKEADATLRALG